MGREREMMARQLKKDITVDTVPRRAWWATKLYRGVLNPISSGVISKLMAGAVRLSWKRYEWGEEERDGESFYNMAGETAGEHRGKSDTCA